MSKILNDQNIVQKVESIQQQPQKVESIKQQPFTYAKWGKTSSSQFL